MILSLRHQLPRADLQGHVFSRLYSHQLPPTLPTPILHHASAEEEENLDLSDQE